MGGMGKVARCTAPVVAASFLLGSALLENVEGNDRSDPLVEMAYAAELAGQPAVRDALVEEVLDGDPDNERAHWLVGQIRSDAGWTTSAEFEQRSKQDKRLQEYLHRREACGEDADSRLQLANWCRDHHMPDRERLHLTELVNQHGPEPAVMKRLRMIRFRGQWISEQDLDEFRRLDNRQRRTEKKWRPIFAEWKDDLKAGDAPAYQRLTERLETVTEDDAFPILEEVLSAQGEKIALAVVARLDQLPTQAATESLVRHALFSESEVVQAAAVEALKKRSIYNYIPMLLAELSAPLETIIELPHGGTNYVRLTIVQRGPDADLKVVDHQAQYAARARLSLIPTAAALAPQLPPNLTPGHYVEKGTERTQLNDRIQKILYLLTGTTHDDTTEWWDWWRDYNEYERDPEKPMHERHRYRYSWNYRVFRPVVRRSCLASSTPVATETGSRPVEQILPGDKVLAQDPDTGELAYKVVLQRTVRRLGAMRKIAIGDESITVTLGHPFWVVGKGWRMAKELTTGQRVRSLDSSSKINAIEELPEDVAYNLVVDDFATYFAGNARLLLHDNTLPEPTDAILPGYVADSR